MLFTKFIRGMAAGALALAALGAHAHTVPNTPLEKIPLQSALCAPAHEAQVLDVPEENAFIYGDCASGTTINPYKYIDPDGRDPRDWIPQGAPIVAVGNSLGALAAYAVGAATGNQALQSAGMEGMHENRAGSTEALVLVASMGRGSGAAPKGGGLPNGAIVVRGGDQYGGAIYKCKRS